MERLIEGKVRARAWKGEFEHYDEIKDYIYKVHKSGGDVKILKGRDNRASHVVENLNSKVIPVGVYDDIGPKIRLYICDYRYLFFVVAPGKVFIGFMGSDPKTLESGKNYLNGNGITHVNSSLDNSIARI